MLDETFFSACVMLCHFKRYLFSPLKSWKMSFLGWAFESKTCFFQKVYSTPLGSLTFSDVENQIPPFYVGNTSGQIIATSHDLTPNGSKWWFGKGNPSISGKPRLVKCYNLARIHRFNWYIDPLPCYFFVGIFTCNLAWLFARPSWHWVMVFPSFTQVHWIFFQGIFVGGNNDEETRISRIFQMMPWIYWAFKCYSGSMEAKYVKSCDQMILRLVFEQVYTFTVKKLSKEIVALLQLNTCDSSVAS